MLSRGQRQRIGIAWVILRNAALLLQAGIIIILTNLWVLLQPLALETIYDRHFKSFLNSFFNSCRLSLLVKVQKTWFWLIQHGIGLK